jgi:hypothetical protein
MQGWSTFNLFLVRLFNGQQWNVFQCLFLIAARDYHSPPPASLDLFTVIGHEEGTAEPSPVDLLPEEFSVNLGRNHSSFPPCWLTTGSFRLCDTKSFLD